MSRPQNSIMFMLIILLLLSVTLNISFSKNLKDVFTYESQCLMNKELGKTSVYWGSCLASLLMIFYIFNDFTYLMLLKEWDKGIAKTILTVPWIIFDGIDLAATIKLPSKIEPAIK